MKYIIRKLKKEDLPKLVTLCQAHALYEKATYTKTNKEALLLKNIFDIKNDLQCDVVQREGSLIGYTTYIKQFSTWDANYYVYLDCLFIEESYRSKGIGKELMVVVKKYATIEKCSHIQWQTPSFNKRAIEFYNRLGAIRKEKLRFFWNV